MFSTDCVVRDMSRESDQSSTRAGGDVLLSQSDCDAIIDSNDRDTPFLLASAGDNSDPNHQRRMEVEFEADFGMEYGGMEYEGMESKQKIHQQDSASDGGITTEETDSTLGVCVCVCVCVCYIYLVFRWDGSRDSAMSSPRETSGGR